MDKSCLELGLHCRSQQPAVQPDKQTAVTRECKNRSCSEWKNFKILGLPYLVFILKFDFCWPWLLGKREKTAGKGEQG